MLPPYDRPIKLVQDSAEQGCSPSSGQFFARLRTLSSRLLSYSSLTHPILNISTARAANLSTLLQLPPVPSIFPPSSSCARKIVRSIHSFFFPSSSFFYFSLSLSLSLLFKKEFVILDLISSAERNFISPLRSSSFDTNFNKGQVAPGFAGKMHALEVRAIATRGQASIKPFVDRFPIFSPFFSPPCSLSIWLSVLLLFSPESSCTHN